MGEEGGGGKVMRKGEEGEVWRATKRRIAAATVWREWRYLQWESARRYLRSTADLRRRFLSLQRKTTSASSWSSFDAEHPPMFRLPCLSWVLLTNWGRKTME
ncbi:hypothetical protein AAC387_Pa04g1855 [Persea americana]